VKRDIFWIVVTLIFFGYAGYILLPPITIYLLSFSERMNIFSGVTLRWYIYWYRTLIRAIHDSMIVALPATTFTMAVGVPTAYVLGRNDFRGKSFVSQLTLLPMILPTVSLGFAFLQLFNTPPFLIRAYPAIVIAHTVVCLPYVVRPLIPAFEDTRNITFEEAAQSLGASGTRAFRDVSLPLLLPSFLTATTFAFARSIGDLVQTLFLTDGTILTLPLAVFEAYASGSPQLGSAAAVVANFFTLFFILGVEQVIMKRIRSY